MGARDIIGLDQKCYLAFRPSVSRAQFLVDRCWGKITRVPRIPHLPLTDMEGGDIDKTYLLSTRVGLGGHEWPNGSDYLLYRDYQTWWARVVGASFLILITVDQTTMM